MDAVAASVKCVGVYRDEAFSMPVTGQRFGDAHLHRFYLASLSELAPYVDAEALEDDVRVENDALFAVRLGSSLRGRRAIAAREPRRAQPGSFDPLSSSMLRTGTAW